MFSASAGFLGSDAAWTVATDPESAGRGGRRVGGVTGSNLVQRILRRPPVPLWSPETDAL